MLVDSDGLLVDKCNVNALRQRTPFGTNDNLVFFDSQDTCMFGATQTDAYRIYNNFQGPLNLNRRHIPEDFNANFGNALPSEWSRRDIGRGAVVSYKRPSRLLLTTDDVATGDGALLTMNNLSLQSDANTYLYFCLNMWQDKNVDLQFGLCDVTNDGTGEVFGNDVIRFSYQAGVTPADISCRCSRGGSVSTWTPTWGAILGRRMFCIKIPRNIPGIRGPVTFAAADDQNVLQPVGGGVPNDPAIPTPDQQLVPYIQLRSYGLPAAVTLELDTVYLITEW